MCDSLVRRRAIPRLRAVIPGEGTQAGGEVHRHDHPAAPCTGDHLPDGQHRTRANGGYDGEPTGNDAATGAGAYVTARRDGTVELARRTFGVPPGPLPTGLTLLRGTILQPGQAVGATPGVPLPLTPLRPYVELAKMRLPDPVKKVVFCLGASRQDVLPERLRNGVAQGVAAPPRRPTTRCSPIPAPTICSARPSTASTPRPDRRTPVPFGRPVRCPHVTGYMWLSSGVGGSLWGWQPGSSGRIT